MPQVYSDESKANAKQNLPAGMVNLAEGQFRPKGKNHCGWKGDNVGYGALHSWVEREMGKPKFCSDCGSTADKRYVWANVSGKYKRDLKDFKRLCPSCHMKFDKRSIGELNAQAKLKENQVIKIRKMHIMNNYTKLELSKKFKISLSSISNIINYRSWKHIRLEER